MTYADDDLDFDPDFDPEPPRPLRGLGTAAVVAVALFTAVKALDGVVGLTSADRLGDPGAASDAPVPPTVLASLATAGLVALVMTFWLYRARRNLDTFAEAEPRWSTGWTVGALFIPCANIVLVPVVLADVVRWSVTDEFGGAGRRRRLVGLVWGCLVCYLLASFSGGLLSAFAQGSGPSPTTGWVGLGLTVVGGVMLMAVVRGVTTAQQARITRLAALSP